MDGKGNDASTWILNSSRATLRAGALRGEVDVAHPDRGLHAITLAGRQFEGDFLCVRRQTEVAGHRTIADGTEGAWPLNVREAYVRGTDLVAGYEPADFWPYSPQIYWQADASVSDARHAGSLSLLVSVQTHLLDTLPRISVSSSIACSETLLVNPRASGKARAETICDDREIQPLGGACCVLRRLAKEPFSYAEIMPASDFREVAIVQEGNDKYRVQWELFAEFLEKGVIRRSRLQCTFLPRENDVSLAAACCAAVEQRPLPLTT